MGTRAHSVAGFRRRFLAASAYVAGQPAGRRRPGRVLPGLGASPGVGTAEGFPVFPVFPGAVVRPVTPGKSGSRKRAECGGPWSVPAWVPAGRRERRGIFGIIGISGRYCTPPSARGHAGSKKRASGSGTAHFLGKTGVMERMANHTYVDTLVCNGSRRRWGLAGSFRVGFRLRVRRGVGRESGKLGRAPVSPRSMAGKKAWSIDRARVDGQQRSVGIAALPRTSRLEERIGHLERDCRGFGTGRHRGPAPITLQRPARPRCWAGAVTGGARIVLAPCGISPSARRACRCCWRFKLLPRGDAEHHRGGVASGCSGAQGARRTRPFGARVPPGPGAGVWPVCVVTAFLLTCSVIGEGVWPAPLTRVPGSSRRMCVFRGPLRCPSR